MPQNLMPHDEVSHELNDMYTSIFGLTFYESLNLSDTRMCLVFTSHACPTNPTCLSGWPRGSRVHTTKLFSSPSCTPLKPLSLLHANINLAPTMYVCLLAVHRRCSTRAQTRMPATWTICRPSPWPSRGITSTYVHLIICHRLEYIQNNTMRQEALHPCVHLQRPRLHTK